MYGDKNVNKVLWIFKISSLISKYVHTNYYIVNCRYIRLYISENPTNSDIHKL